MNRINSILIIASCSLLSVCAQAYVGPGAGLSAIGSILAFLGALFLLIVGFLWYPIKRLLKGKKQKEAQEVTADVSDDIEGSDLKSEIGVELTREEAK